MEFNLLPLSHRLYKEVKVVISIEVSRLLFKFNNLREMFFDISIVFNMFEAKFKLRRLIFWERSI